ncbi:MAG: V-type ATPase subunit [Nitrospiria bacterium]
MDDYAYLNARVRSLRYDLLGNRVYEELMNLPGVSSAGEILGKTVYGKCLPDSPEFPSLNQLEEGLREEWVRTANKIYQMTGGVARVYLEVLMGLWEVENLKTILRGKTHHFGEREILSALLPIGSLNQPALAELVRQPSVEGIMDRLAAWRSPYTKPLRKVLKGQPELKSLYSLELFLDHYIFEDTVKKLKNGDQEAVLFGRLIGLIIDKSNLLTAFKLFREKTDSRFNSMDCFIQGGNHLNLGIFQEIIKTDNLNNVVEIIKKTPYSEAVRELNTEGGILPALRLELGLNRLILRRARRMGIDEPLGFGLIAGYLLQKYYEGINLRVILRTKAYGMYDSDIRSFLVV